MRSQKFFVMLIVALAHTLKSQSYLHRNLQRRAFNPKLYSGLESVKQIEKPLKNGISVKDASMSTVELGTSSRLRTGSSIVNPEMTDIKDFQSFKTSSSLTGEGYPVQQTHDKVFPKKGEDIDFSVEYGRSSKNLGGIETGSDSIKMSTKNLAGQEKTDNIYKTKSTFTSYDSKIMRKPSEI
ncbi:hypothetical protein BY996DRAFT_2013444 [Phakopsora pachyrhizi]|nr:hypothetical protein BY996DRAFT_2013444 [Phakopsora pachyrhizi]